jgi:glycosyltransferase involved in cell wall biosynthesis
MRIALLANFAPRKLGSFEHWVIALCAEARRRGHEVHPFGRSPVHAEFARRLGAVGAGWESIDDLLRSPLKAIGRLRRYDLLHVNMFTPRTPIALLAYASFPARVAFTDHISGSSIDEERRLMASRGLLGRIARWIGSTLAGRGVDRLISLRLSGIAGVSDYVRERDRLRFGLKERKVRTIYNGVDLQRFRPRDASNLSQSPVNVLCVAYLIREKGVDYLLHAFSKVRDQTARLTIAGDGPEEETLKDLADRLGLSERVSFLGLRDDVDQLLAEADIVVHPAIWSEACGLTIVEAMASGCPLIASRVGGIPELVEDQKTGVLVPPKDVPALTQALNLLVENPQYRLRLARNAQGWAAEHLDVNDCVQRHLDWFEQLVTTAPITAITGARA